MTLVTVTVWDRRKQHLYVDGLARTARQKNPHSRVCDHCYWVLWWLSVGNLFLSSCCFSPLFIALWIGDGRVLSTYSVPGRQQVALFLWWWSNGNEFACCCWKRFAHCWPTASLHLLNIIFTSYSVLSTLSFLHTAIAVFLDYLPLLIHPKQKWICCSSCFLNISSRGNWVSASYACVPPPSMKAHKCVSVFVLWVHIHVHVLRSLNILV